MTSEDDLLAMNESLELFYDSAAGIMAQFRAIGFTHEQARDLAFELILRGFTEQDEDDDDE